MSSHPCIANWNNSGDKKELYIVNNPDDMFDWDRLDEDGIRYVANKLGIKVTNDFAGRSYDFDYYQKRLCYLKFLSYIGHHRKYQNKSET